MRARRHDALTPHSPPAANSPVPWRAYNVPANRTTWLALWVQVIVAAAAATGSVVLVLIAQTKGTEIARQNVEIQRQSEEIRRASEEIRSQSEEIERQSAEIGKRNTQLEVRAAAVDQLASLPRLIDNEQFDDAIMKLRAALDALNGVPDDANEQARDTFQRPLRRALAQVYHLKGLDKAAIQEMANLRLRPSPDADQASLEAILLATYYCADGQANQARPLLAAEAARDARVLKNEFGAACRALIAELRPAATSAAASAPANPEYKIAYASLQIRDERQRVRAVQVAQSLCRAGYGVPSIELVAGERSYPPAGGIRYYYAEQSEEAERIAELIGPAGAPLATRRLVGFGGLPRNRIEIWLPALGGENAQTAERNFSCAPGAPADAQAFGLTLRAR